MSLGYYNYPDGLPVQYAAKTIEEWYYDYKRFGWKALRSRKRRDCGQSRSITPEIADTIIDMRKRNPGISARAILKKLVELGIIKRGEISRSSVYRLLSSNKTSLSIHSASSKKEVKKYSFEFSNDCWQTDVKHGPYVKLDGFRGKKKIYLYAFIDDASRVIPGAGIFIAENLKNFLQVFKVSLMKKGLPSQIYMDNASYYRSPLVKLIGMRLGIRIVYCTPYSPRGKGKIERFWRTAQEQFLSTIDLQKTYSLKELNNMFTAWIEKEYHHNRHSALGQSPIMAWQRKAVNIRYPDNSQLEENFLAQTTRLVRNDSTFTLNGIHYEVDSVFIGRKLAVRYDHFSYSKVYIDYPGLNLIRVYPVREVDNQKIKRKKIVEGTTYKGLSFQDLFGDNKENK